MIRDHANRGMTGEIGSGLRIPVDRQRCRRRERFRKRTVQLWDRQAKVLF